MPKQKYTAFDVAAVVAALRRAALGCWLANAYDVDATSGNKKFLLKLNKPSGAVARDARADATTAESEKILVFIESGTRVHTTRYERGKTTAPTAFTAKLRARAKGKRLTDARQLGRDRAIDFTFGGGGENECHLIVELYSQGNVILCDGNYTVVALLRSYRDGGDVNILPNHQYPLERLKGFQLGGYTREDVVSALARGVLATEEETMGGDARRAPATLREALCRAFGYSPAIADHVALTASIEHGSNASLPLSEACVDRLTAAVRDLESWFEGVTTGDVVAVPNVCTKTDANADGTDEIEIFDDFSPFSLKQNEGRPTRKFELPKGLDPVCAFDHAVDEYFIALEAQSQILARRKAEAQALAKLEKSLKDQKSRVEQLEREREKEEQRAVLIEYNHEAVDTAIDAVNSALASGMSWPELEAMINEERRLGNPVAGMIKSLDLANNQITITLANHLDEVDEVDAASGKRKRVAVGVDLGLSAHANASMRFAAKKKHAEKFSKTVDAQSKAVAAAEAKAKAAMEKAANGSSIARARQPLWFEKFNWFITSENCLVLQAKDATQAEMLITRYMLPGDAFVHAEVPQAPVTLVKPPPGVDVRAVPAYSLVQAGAAVMCRSSAWNSRAVKSAWWTSSERVSKISPVAGDALPPGVTHVAHADKQFLPHAQLVMGFGLMFVVSEKNAEAHKNERLVRSDFNILEEEGDETFDEDDEQEDERDDANGGAEIRGEVNKLAAFLDGAVGFAGEDERSSVDDGDENDDDDGDTVAAAPSPAKPATPRMSAKERKTLKKKKGGKGGNDSDGDGDDDFIDPLAEMKKKSSSKTVPIETKKAPRGKAAKLKRAKAKYADQDEEDRALAMEFLGASGGSGGKKVTGASKKAAKAAEKFEERKQEKPTAPSAPEPAPAPFVKRREAAAAAFARKAAADDDFPAKYQDDEDDDESKASLVPDEASIEERLKLDAERLEIVNRIVSAPFKDDDIEYCLPVCAPITATNALKYRMKVTPGSQKKGKAAKLAMHILPRAPFPTPRELACVKAVADVDAAVALPAGCKISLPPGAAKSMSKGGKKKRR